MKAKRKLYSYIKKPLSADGWISLAIAGASFASAQYVVTASVIKEGDCSLTMAALCIISVLLAASAILFALAGISDKEKNPLAACAAVVISLIVLAEWAVIMSI